MKSSDNFKYLLIALFFAGTGIIDSYGSDSLYIALADSIDIIVAADGTGHYLTVQEAINAVPDAGAKRMIIYIRNGHYFEKILIPSTKPNITLIGQDADSTILDYDDYSGRVVDGDTLGTSDTYSFGLDADNFQAMNLTFSNSAGDVGQAVALRTRGDRQAFLHCKMLGYQDTYYTWGYDRNYLKDCFIAGAIDFIFGRTTTIFDSCQIHSLRESSYITAANTEENVLYGYVFFNCKLTAQYGKRGIFLGRPWKLYARTVFFECEEGDFLSKAGWSIWEGNSNHTTCYYAEYNCFGDGSDTAGRASWSYQLTPEEAADYTTGNIFSVATNPGRFDEDWLPGFDSDYYYSQVKRYTTKFMDSINYNTRLSSILLNGDEIEGFHPDIREYVVELPSGTTQVPELEGILSDSLASLSNRLPSSVPGWTTFIVIARDGATNEDYRVFLSVDSAYTNAKLKTLQVNYDDVPGFQPDVYDYELTLPFGTTALPTIRAYPEVSGAVREISQTQELPGTGTVMVTALDVITQSLYTVSFLLAPDAISETEGYEEIRINNPVNGQIIVKLPADYSGSVQFELYDLQGMKILSLPYQTSAMAQNSFLVQSGHLKQGVYLYRIQANGRVHSGKLLKAD